MENVLSLSSVAAKVFFLKGESYINFNLPPYFNFYPLLLLASRMIESSPLVFDDILKAKKEEQVNYMLLNNKDGKYNWRPLQIINPILYTSLVHIITKNENWELIQNRFYEFNSKTSVICESMPVVSDNEQSDKAEQVSHWVEKVEKPSLALGLEFEYLFEADITNCYGSIYTHSIAWALHNKSEAKDRRRYEDLLGNKIDQHLQAMSYGQTNGIPQGSVLMDFIAELLLGYADTILTKKIENINGSDYRIIRYRDDYRIFVNNPKIGEEILKNLTEILSDLGLKLNTHKTKQSDDIILNSIKPDKLHFVEYVNEANSLKDNLLILHSASKKYPNSGRVAKRLENLLKRELKNVSGVQGDPNHLISIVVNIALKNPRTYHVISAMLSMLMDRLETDQDKRDVIDKVINKFKQIPNTGHLLVWLQRASIKIDRKISYNEKLCDIAMDPSGDLDLWNNIWAPSALLEHLKEITFIDEDEILSLKSVISVKEVELFRDDVES